MHAIRMDIITVAAPVIHVVTGIAATGSLVIHAAATAKPSVPVIHVATVTAATESLVINVAAAAKLSVKANS